MNDLLESAVAAHGGLGRWNQVKSITVDAAITGALWALKSKGDALKDVRFEVDTTRERLTMDLAGQDKRSVFEPRRVVLQRRDGALIDAREDPERSFDGHQLATPQLPADRGRAAARPLRDRPHPGPRRAQVGDLHPFLLRQVPVRDLPPDHSPPRDHRRIMQLPAVPGGDRAAVSPPFPGPRVDPDDPARLQAAEPLPDQPRVLLPLLDLRQRPRSPASHRNSRICRVLRRPLESAEEQWGQIRLTKPARQRPAFGYEGPYSD